MRFFGLSGLRGIGLDPYREPTTVYPGHNYVTVRWLQRALVSGGADIVADGIWGTATRDALDAFIARMGLASLATGVLYRRDTRVPHLVAVRPALEQALADASPSLLEVEPVAPAPAARAPAASGITTPKLIGIGLVVAGLLVVGAVVIAGER